MVWGVDYPYRSDALVAHPSSRLSVFRRQPLVKRVLVDGWLVATVADRLGISRATGYKCAATGPMACPGSRTGAPCRTTPHRRLSAEETARHDHRGTRPTALGDSHRIHRRSLPLSTSIVKVPPGLNELWWELASPPVIGTSSAAPGASPCSSSPEEESG